MVVEVEGIKGEFFIEPGLLEPEPDSVLQAMICLGLGELIEDKKGVAIFLFCLLDDLFNALGHDLES